MTPITELADVIRSKNAGPYRLTLDVIFSKDEVYEHVRDRRSLTRERIARIYGIPEEDVTDVIYFDPARAVKIVMKRPVVSGQPGDTDVYGAQQHGPLLALELEI